MLNTKEKMLFVWPFLLLVALPVAWKAFNSGDRLDKEQRRLAGPKAIDCGIGRMRTLENNLVFQDRAAADECSVQAFKAKKPFFVRYDTEAEEWIGTWSMGILRTPQGKVHFTQHGFYPGLRRRDIQYVSAVCPTPILINGAYLRKKPWKQVGCGTCSSMASADTASCILHPAKP